MATASAASAQPQADGDLSVSGDESAATGDSAAAEMPDDLEASQLLSSKLQIRRHRRRRRNRSFHSRVIAASRLPQQRRSSSAVPATPPMVPRRWCRARRYQHLPARLHGEGRNVRRRRISGGFESDGDDGSANQLQQAAGGSAIASWYNAVSSTSRPPLTGRERDVLALSNELSRADSELLWRALLSCDSLRWSTPAQLVKYATAKTIRCAFWRPARYCGDVASTNLL